MTRQLISPKPISSSWPHSLHTYPLLSILYIFIHSTPTLSSPSSPFLLSHLHLHPLHPYSIIPISILSTSDPSITFPSVHFLPIYMSVPSISTAYERLLLQLLSDKEELALMNLTMLKEKPHLCRHVT